MGSTILLVEDNIDLRDSVETYLTAEGYEVIPTGTVGHAEKLCAEIEFTAAIIDINLPDKSGFDFVKELRKSGLTMPLIAMTARDEIIDKVRGFEIGLTDYIVKPFSLAELAARLRAHLREVDEKHQESLETSNIKLLPLRREVIVDSETVTLTGTEFRLLESLVVNRRKIVSTDDLIAHAWGEADRFSDPPLRIHMRNIRKKLHDDDHKRIRTVAGTGYMLDD